jgi:folylpolyglutamate synthase/dihydropteroate synthase
VSFTHIQLKKINIFGQWLLTEKNEKNMVIVIAVIKKKTVHGIVEMLKSILIETLLDFIVQEKLKYTPIQKKLYLSSIETIYSLLLIVKIMLT